MGEIKNRDYVTMSNEDLEALEVRANKALNDLMQPKIDYVTEKSAILRKQMNGLGDMEFLALYTAVMQSREDRLISLRMRFPFLPR